VSSAIDLPQVDVEILILRKDFAQGVTIFRD